MSPEDIGQVPVPKCFFLGPGPQVFGPDIPIALYVRRYSRYVARPSAVYGVAVVGLCQGALGDCYYLAAMANCATREELIEDLIVEDYADVGIYGVKVHRTFENICGLTMTPHCSYK